MQDPRAFTSLGRPDQPAGARGLRSRAGSSARSLMARTWLRLFDLLGKLMAPCKAERRRLILAVDEYENIDGKIGDGTFPLRASRHVPRVGPAPSAAASGRFAGSHDLSELRHAEWPSYFVSLRTIEIGPFSDAETRAAADRPVAPLRHIRRRRVGAGHGSTSPSGATRAFRASKPKRRAGRTLVQLLAEGVVELVNIRGLRAPRRACGGSHRRRPWSEVMPSCGSSSRTISRLDGEWDYLKGFRTRELQAHLRTRRCTAG